VLPNQLANQLQADSQANQTRPLTHQGPKMQPHTLNGFDTRINIKYDGSPHDCGAPPAATPAAAAGGGDAAGAGEATPPAPACL